MTLVFYETVIVVVWVVRLSNKILSNRLPVIFTQPFGLKALHIVCIPYLLIMLTAKLGHLFIVLPVA